MAFIGYFFAILTIVSVHAVQYQYANFQNNQGFKQPQFRTISMSTFKPMVFPTFPTFPTFSPQDIINKKVAPGVNFNGISVSSSSSLGVDKDGNVIRTEGTKVFTNRNGVVEEVSYPDTSNSNINIVSSTVPFVPPIDSIIIKNSKAGYNEEFSGTSFVSYRHESNINGGRKIGGVETIIVNDNGKVDKKTYKYGDLNEDLK